MAYPLSAAEAYFTFRAPGLSLEDCDLSCTVYDDGDIKVSIVWAPGCDTNLLTSDDELLRQLGERIRDAALADDDFREDVYERANVRSTASSHWAPIQWEAA